MDLTPVNHSHEISDWLTLERVPLVGPLTMSRLIESFGNPRSVLQASATEIRQKTGLPERLCKAVASFEPPYEQIQKDITLLEGLKAKIVTRWGHDYPTNLTDIYDPPAILFVRGSLFPEDSQAIAMVGTRNPTRYGVEFARSITRDLVRASFTIVSGLARGIDTVCHQTALKEGGRSIAVIGCGLDIIYPKENAALIDHLAESGAVISEFRPGVEPLKTNFFRRNRIVSGLSKAVVVVQAAKKSGSLITAFHGLDQNRDVFAVPGNVTNERSKGPHFLIKQGAGLVESAEDILTSLSTCDFKGKGSEIHHNNLSVVQEETELSDLGKRILDFLDSDLTSIDTICESLQVDPGRLSGALLELELLGLVRQNPGKLFSRVIQ
ncbi:MAG: DNA-processing protein DprA [Desulfomonilaceae bacterium]